MNRTECEAYRAEETTRWLAHIRRNGLSCIMVAREPQGIDLIHGEQQASSALAVSALTRLVAHRGGAPLLFVLSKCQLLFAGSGAGEDTPTIRYAARTYESKSRGDGHTQARKRGLAAAALVLRAAEARKRYEAAQALTGAGAAAPKSTEKKFEWVA